MDTSCLPFGRRSSGHNFTLCLPAGHGQVSGDKLSGHHRLLLHELVPSAVRHERFRSYKTEHHILPRLSAYLGNPPLFFFNLFLWLLCAGYIPPELGGLACLEQMYLNHNQLSGACWHGAAWYLHGATDTLSHAPFRLDSPAVLVAPAGSSTFRVALCLRGVRRVLNLKSQLSQLPW